MFLHFQTGMEFTVVKSRDGVEEEDDYEVNCFHDQFMRAVRASDLRECDSLGEQKASIANYLNGVIVLR